MRQVNKKAFLFYFSLFQLRLNCLTSLSTRIKSAIKVPNSDQTGL